MWAIIDIHSLPKGINGMPFGESGGHFGWFNNTPALKYSYQAVEAALEYIASSKYAQMLTLETLNRPVDNTGLGQFGSRTLLSDSGAVWVLRYLEGVLERAASMSPSTPIMIQGGFQPISYWASLLPAGANVVFDVHNYYVARRWTTLANLPFYLSPGVGTSPSS